jgi:hypothetical protein
MHAAILHSSPEQGNPDSPKVAERAMNQVQHNMNSMAGHCAQLGHDIADPSATPLSNAVTFDPHLDAGYMGDMLLDRSGLAIPGIDDDDVFGSIPTPHHNDNRMHLGAPGDANNNMATGSQGTKAALFPGASFQNWSLLGEQTAKRAADVATAAHVRHNGAGGHVSTSSVVNSAVRGVSAAQAPRAANASASFFGCDSAVSDLNGHGLNAARNATTCSRRRSAAYLGTTQVLVSSSKLRQVMRAKRKGLPLVQLQQPVVRARSRPRMRMLSSCAVQDAWGNKVATVADQHAPETQQHSTGRDMLHNVAAAPSAGGPAAPVAPSALAAPDTSMSEDDFNRIVHAPAASERCTREDREEESRDVIDSEELPDVPYHLLRRCPLCQCALNSRNAKHCIIMCCSVDVFQVFCACLLPVLWWLCAVQQATHCWYLRTTGTC